MEKIAEDSQDIGRLASLQFGLARQTVSWHMKQLVKDGLVSVQGNTRARRYQLTPFINEFFTLDVNANLEEDRVWRERASPLIQDADENVIAICQYGFTEMLNNVRSHSESSQAFVAVIRDAVNIRLIIKDEGVGIFNKIQKQLGLHDPRHALLELSKGKVTTDPESHSGEGLFFTSRMFSRFSILSGSLYFRRQNQEGDDWLIDVDDKGHELLNGTMITMDISVSATHTISEVLTRFASEHHDYGFTKTHVPMQLVRYEGEQLVSRSQARRLLARVDQFKEVLLDFKGITMIGQAFADEIFRVFQHEHPGIFLIFVRATPEVAQMIKRVITTSQPTAEPAAASEQQRLF